MSTPDTDHQSQDLVIDAKNLEQAPVPMDTFVDLLAEERECARMADWWTKRREQIRESLGQILGEREIGTVNGEEAIFYERQNRFRSGDFKKQYPNLFRAYSHTVTKEELDVELLKTARPDLYSEFQVRAMRVTYEVPGADTPRMPR